jgi:glycerol-3-phosphate O-acyltransferase
MSDVRTYRRDRRAIADAVIARVGGNPSEVAAIVDEIAGGFSPALHAATIALLPHALGPAFGGTFHDRVEVEGDLAGLRDIAARSTLILAPTHASNLDSIVLGVLAGRARLPPFAYAAGRHIYRHPVIAALMRRLGAYKLDPDRRDRLYLRVVNVYVNELVARGYHTIVFPSGTRGRSGEVETNIKLGLLGAAVHVPRPVTIVPITINYQVVLESEHLIAYYLAGRSHERIVGDELFVPSRLLDSIRRLRTLEQRVVVGIGEPLEPRVDDAGWRSRLVASITASYREHTVFFATHVVARALYDAVAKENAAVASRDHAPAVWREHAPAIALDDAVAAIAKTRALLARDPKLGNPWQGLAGLSDDHVLDEALAAWRSWHRTPPASRSASTAPSMVEITNSNLLLYYRNRTAHVLG